MNRKRILDRVNSKNYFKEKNFFKKNLHKNIFVINKKKIKQKNIKKNYFTAFRKNDKRDLKEHFFDFNEMP